MLLIFLVERIENTVNIQAFERIHVEVNGGFHPLLLLFQLTLSFVFSFKHNLKSACNENDLLDPFNLLICCFF